MTGMSKTYVYARIRDGNFPKQIQLGSHSVVWLESAVMDWMQQQMKGA